MRHKTRFPANLIIRLSMSLIILLPTITAHADEPTPRPGTYCTSDTGTLSLVTEELSVTINLVLHSLSLQGKATLGEKISSLQSANLSLQLAAGRGVARIITLIDAVIAAHSSEDYTQQLTWMPLLQTAMLSLPDDARTGTASDLISRAEDIMQTEGKGDPMQHLREARHMLACDALDLPLQEARQAQQTLLKQFAKGKPVSAKAYATLIDSLRTALLYVLQKDNEAPLPSLP